MAEKSTALLVPVTDGGVISDLPSKLDGRSYPIFNGTKFENPWATWSWPGLRGGFALLTQRLGSNGRQPLPSPNLIDSELPLKTPHFVESNYIPSTLEITWIGHSTVLVRMDGISIITDPIFSSFNSGLRKNKNRRYRPPACSIDQLPDDLRIVLISHNHNDHLDLESLEAIYHRFGDRVIFCVPKGLALWCHNNLSPKIRIFELNWWQIANFQLGLDGSGTKFHVISVPAQHWSMRNPFDVNRSLWCGYVVVGPKARKFYFAGDTGYCSAFKEIGAELGPIDLAAIPIGAYKPREFLGPQHISPFEAADIFLEIQCKKAVGIHWGTLRLGGENYLDPRSDLAIATAERNLLPNSFVTLNHGETLAI